MSILTVTNFEIRLPRRRFQFLFQSPMEAVPGTWFVLFSGAQPAGYASSACAQVAMRFLILGKFQDT
jgi:hypothetical protein